MNKHIYKLLGELYPLRDFQAIHDSCGRYPQYVISRLLKEGILFNDPDNQGMTALSDRGKRLYLNLQSTIDLALGN